MGFEGAKLCHLRMQNCLFAPTAHNAPNDDEPLIDLLARRLANA
ncbi:MAG: hypothetical protein OSA47_07765 [Novosphingopyxis baekryungensis]|nr:hypothetical protein [Novosphingopyxis baekryungensis]